MSNYINMKMKDSNTPQTNRTGLMVFLLAVVLFLSGTVYSFGQEAYGMTQREFHKFKLGKSHHYAGQQYFLKKKYAKAEKAFQKCLTVFPQYSSAYYYLAKIQYHREDYLNGLKNILLAKQHYKFMNDLEVNSQLQYMKTLRTQKENLQKDLNNPMGRQQTSQRGEMEKKIQDIDSKLSKPVVVARHMPADYFYLHGNLFFKVKKLKEAHDQFVEAIRVNPQHPASYNNLINLYHMIKNYPMASKYIDKAKNNGVKLNQDLIKAVQKAMKK
jgi:tetratricopeptide (TPR) repeat protein